jgi:hypothetical protein
MAGVNRRWRNQAGATVGVGVVVYVVELGSHSALMWVWASMESESHSALRLASAEPGSGSELTWVWATPESESHSALPLASAELESGSE